MENNSKKDKIMDGFDLKTFRCRICGMQTPREMYRLSADICNDCYDDIEVSMWDEIDEDLDKSDFMQQR